MGAAKRLITVLLAEAHAILREGYRRSLQREGDIVVIAEASNGKDAIGLARRLSPHVVAMNVTLPGISGIEAMKMMLSQRAFDSRVLIFSRYEDVIFAHHALQAGATGYVTISDAATVLVEAVQSVAQGRRYVEASMRQDLALRNAALDMPPSDRLSAREFEVMRRRLRGRSVSDIGKSLQLNPQAVMNYCAAVKRKLNAESALPLLRLADQLGLNLQRLK